MSLLIWCVMKTFDLNIETVLEDWGVHHAVREIIANALDEQTLTKTQDVAIFKDPQDRWHIRDYGRGLRHDHLTQNENQEKMCQRSCGSLKIATSCVFVSVC